MAFGAEGLSVDNAIPNVLILYDATGPSRWVGYIDSLFLANLIGHFQRNYIILPVEQYSKNRLNEFDTTFYLGTIYNNPLPHDFIQDVLTTTKDVVWFGHNLWQICSPLGKCDEKFGFQFAYNDFSSVQCILYKQNCLTKNALDPGLGKITITNPNVAKIIATATFISDMRNDAIPYISHGNNLWYVGDVPFSYITEDDRYLVIADVLFDMLRVKTPIQRRALLRLEDVNPTYDPQLLRNTADYLYEERIPFSVSVIPCYTDPQGYYNQSKPQTIKMTDRPEFIAALKYMIAKGGNVVIHGYTHQYTTVSNPYVGISGSDYEFFRITRDVETDTTLLYQPVDEDALEWVQERVESAEALFKNATLETSIWETPHYTASSIC